jgi:hypothetical protein
LVESIYGLEFVPFAESIIVKLPENGAENPYHQDGNRYNGLVDRGLNIGIYLHPSSEENGCLRVIPDTHRGAKSTFTPCVIHTVPSCQEAYRCVHHPATSASTTAASSTDRFPNTSSDVRVTIYFGYHKLSPR